MSKTWKSTLRLPKSTLPPRPLPQLREQYIRRSADELYEWQKTNRPADDTFILHDGPPYANGGLHVGHALNKILKDTILRVKLQQGRRVEYIPGWDCHGLPIELKALENSNSKQLTPIEIRKSARNLASNTVLKQMKSFRSYGVMGDWERRWTTMDTAFEVRQLRLFQKMVKKGLIDRRYKPVYWSPSSKTALAEAELEYNENHISTSAWVRMPIADSWRELPQFKEVGQQLPGRLYALVWTTTPWTLPANQAVAVHGDLEYAVVQDGNAGFLIATSRVDEFISKVPAKEFQVTAHTFRGDQLRVLEYTNPLQGKSAKLQPVIHADFVSADSGSGLVHLAPGHGFDDYEVCRPLGLPVTAPIDDEGRFTSDALPDDPQQLTSAPSINAGGSRVILDILGQDVLLAEKYKHKYPYDWRSKQPVVVRATEQWFADVASIKDEVLEAMTRVTFTPESGRKRLESFVKGRSEWCISRQRAWGVPIPALYDQNGKALVTEETVEHIISVIQERGTSAWWSDAWDDPAWIPPNMQRKFRRGTDTMDVWFDSGSSWTMMSGQADVYLEGSDQHRGWFQSSLLTRVAGTDGAVGFTKSAPFKQLITHGFTLDQDGNKMSKSLGNVMEPQQVMDGTLLPPLKRRGKAADGQPAYDALGPDALRLWAAGNDYTKDIVIGVPVLQAVHTALLKYRTIFKMLLGSMHETAREAPLTATDYIAIAQLQDTMKEVGDAYDKHEFHRGFNELNRWVNNDLSAYYLETLKDRLYCGDGGGVLEPIFTGFLRMLSPMTPLLIEEIWDHRPDWMKHDLRLIHPLRQLYSDPIIDPDRLTRDLGEVRKDIPGLMAIYDAVKLGLEDARRDKMLGSSLQGSVVLTISDPKTRDMLGHYFGELETMFIVSSVELNGPIPADAPWAYSHEFEVNATKGTATIVQPKQARCPRCWRYVAPAEGELCPRCADVVNPM
ncbi:tRNA synthetases class I-domain-containing protein [Pseudomassariella vexata]|uniref:Isoleucine--tRNA ligase, mitochondrial n=1 Tax=Pseudomassariella vexata TaxID=1141098 RepID=A0A1Y2DA23_9PEZI|nr:tRNA synthetases class I-domain-containing protein [Pseudomassariella vexata]ORY55515.1 tRNA synthetases class I-domain-containing protein [Pseudomassariella vexata]